MVYSEQQTTRINIVHIKEVFLVFLMYRFYHNCLQLNKELLSGYCTQDTWNIYEHTSNGYTCM